MIFKAPPKILERDKWQYHTNICAMFLVLLKLHVTMFILYEHLDEQERINKNQKFRNNNTGLCEPLV